MAESIRVLLVDDETLLRRCLTIALNRRRGLQVVGEAESGVQAIAEVRTLRPDVPDGGPKLVADICAEVENCAVLVLTSGEHGGASRAIRAGARGYLPKTCELDDLVQVVERVNVGEVVLTSVAVETVLNDLGGGPSRGATPGGLTDRELEVIRLIAQGLTNPEIARELCITEHTTKGHLAKILAKLDLSNRVQLATYAMQQGLVETLAVVDGRS